MPTRAQLEDLLRQAEFEAETLGKYLQDTRDLVADFEAAVKAQQAKVTLYRGMLAKSGTQPLSSIQKKGTLGVPKMEAESASRGAKVSIARTKSTWPFRQALHRRNLSLPEWARSQKGITVEAAKSWLKAPSGGGRPIPLVWAERIAKEFMSDETGSTEVPPVDASWPNGIR